jgi:hypothetical protein
MRTRGGVVVVVACVGLAALSSRRAIAATTCEPTPQGNLCTAQVDFMQFAEQAYMSQLQSEWCWAASISMIFSYYGDPVAQARIVTDVYGAPENIPAMGGIVIAHELNRCWTDDAGGRFVSQVTGVYDAQAGVYGLTNAQAIAELDAGHPMVLGARTHAVVLTAMQYYETPQGPYVVAAGVFDPWPGIGARGLQMDELTPASQGGSLLFAATIRVTPLVGDCPIAPQPQPPGPPGPVCAIATGSAGDAAPTLVVVGVAIVAAARRRRRQAARA